MVLELRLITFLHYCRNRLASLMVCYRTPMRNLPNNSCNSLTHDSIVTHDPPSLSTKSDESCAMPGGRGPSTPASTIRRFEKITMLASPFRMLDNNHNHAPVIQLDLLSQLTTLKYTLKDAWTLVPIFHAFFASSSLVRQLKYDSCKRSHVLILSTN